MEYRVRFGTGLGRGLVIGIGELRLMVKNVTGAASVERLVSDPYYPSHHIVVH